MRDDGGPAFPRQSETHPNGQFLYGDVGMSYRDWLVGKMMVEWWAKTTNLTPPGKFYMALAGDEAITDAIKSAHKIADAIMEVRAK